MKKRISITLSKDLLPEIDLLAGASGSRSAFIEKVLDDHVRNDDHLPNSEWRALQQRDLELINANADALNRESLDVLRYQADIFADDPSPR
jgi:metal-responsive CopG/Arc/MetJ family transcriptional regulator